MMDGRKKTKKEIGELGESLACDFLLSRGQRILERNWRGGHLEIDIISEAADGIHFVEVKSLSSGSAVIAPQDKVGRIKQKRITDAAVRYLHSTEGLHGAEAFFDIITVLYEDGTASLRYYPQAWIPITFGY